MEAMSSQGTLEQFDCPPFIMRWGVKWPDGVVLLRLTSDLVPFFGRQLSEGPRST
ncbi:hypothetical protein GCM10010313_81400 [Streptomyces violarus]|nr:hypothetical protein GCM10010313_81400 [Streptomyces violarus]